MPESTSIFSILLKSIFVGFGFVMPLLALIKTSDLKKLEFKDMYMLTAVQTVRIAGIIYFLTFLLETYFHWQYVRLYGDYWLLYWFPAVMTLLLSQLFWMKKLYMKKPALITLSLLLLVLPSQYFLLLVQSISKGSASFNLENQSPSVLIEFVLNIIVFIFIVFAIMSIGKQFKKKQA